MLRKFYLVATIFMSFFDAFSQDTTKTLAITGSVDSYYRYSFSGK